jgi:hypothetical protein
VNALLPLAKLKAVFNKWLHLEDDSFIDIIVAAYLANKIFPEPLWLLLIAAPSNAKTEVLRAFSGLSSAHFLSNLTPSTLVSGLQRKNGEEPSLLLQLDGKVLILKDFTSILSMRYENQQEVLGQLREIYDGQYSKFWGNGKRIDWTGSVGFIGACTPAYDRHHGTINALGDRFMLYRCKNHEQQEMGLKALSLVGQENEMREEIRTALHSYLKPFDNINKLNITRDSITDNKIVNLACLCAAGRCAVERDYHNKAVLYTPQPEGSPRLVKQLTMLGAGIALAQGKTIFDDDVYELTRKIALNNMPASRRSVIEYLWDKEALEHLKGWRKTGEVADAVRLPKTTTRYVLEDLMLVDLVNREMISLDDNTANEERGHTYNWQLSDRCHEYMTRAEVFKDACPL